jgi:predicted metal-dependent phosphoesterase TrpH
MSDPMKHPLSPVSEYALGRDAWGAARYSRRPTRRIDMHCHSSFSDEYLRYVPGLVYHPLLEPEEVYDLAKARGMDFVTLTDHDTIDGCKALLDRRGDLPDFLAGEEVSAAFPEDGTVVHVNVYDISETEHAEVQRLRGSLYELVDYLSRGGKLFVLNHLTWTAQHRVLKTWQIEKMLELFPVFEGLNGARSFAHNAYTWYATQGRGKVLVAGSDSHTHRVGTTYTLTTGDTRAELIASIRAGVAEPCGAFGTPEKLAEDVWLILQKEVERHMALATSFWQRATCRVVCGLGRLVYPLVCRGYHARQNLLIGDFLRALPT